MSEIVEVWYLFHNGRSNPSKVEVAVDAYMSDLRDATGKCLEFSVVKSQSLTPWKPRKELLIENKAKDVLAEWVRDVNGRFDTVAEKLKPDDVVGSTLFITGKRAVHVIALPKLPEPALAEFP